MRNKILIGLLILVSSQLLSALVCWLLFREVFVGATLAATLPLIIILLSRMKLNGKSY